MVCDSLFLSQLLLDAIVRRQSFRNGLVHVVGRIRWYTQAAQLQVPGSWEDHDKFRQNQSATRDMLVKLNGRVLEFEMNCVCATASAWNAGARNVVRWNTMDQLVDSIIKLEEQVIEIVEQNCTAKVRNTLLMQYRDMDIPSSSVEGS